MAYSSFVSQVTGTLQVPNAFSVLMTRGFTRLKTVFLTMVRDLSAVDPLMTPLNDLLSPTWCELGNYNPAADTVEFTLQTRLQALPGVQSDVPVRGVHETSPGCREDHR